MTCNWIKMPDGTTGVVCTRGRRKTCSVQHCTRPVDRECDFPVNVKGRKSRTCDAGVCSAHARSMGPELDYCPPHARYVDDHGSPESAMPAQADLFRRPR